LRCAAVVNSQEYETMKTVFNNAQCAHVWAQMTQEHGRGASVSFRGGKFYSYSTPIAQIIEAPAPDSGRVVLITSDSYSATTNGKHKAHAWRATSHLTRRFRVPGIANETEGRYRLPGTLTNYRHSWAEVHAANLAYLIDQYRAEAKRLMRATSRFYTDTLRDHADNARMYSRLFFPRRKSLVLPVAADCAAILARQQRLENRPEAVARRAEADRRLEEGRVRQAALYAERRPRWRAGELYGRVDCEDGGAMLRIKRGDVLDRDIVQTSWGADVPLADARKAWRFWLSRSLSLGSEAAFTPWHANGGAVSVGHFTLDSIAADGTVRAGCHTIYRRELEHFGKLLEEVPS
jgi:hypothetical protein